MALFRRFFALALSVGLLTAMVPAVAHAAPDTSMWGSGKVDMADLLPGKAPTYIVTIQLKKSVDLPAKVVVPIPEAVQPIWVGEVFGGDPSMDIPVEDGKFTTEGDTSYLAVTMKNSRVLQVECGAGPDMISNRGSERDVYLYWDAPKMEGDVLAAIVAPFGYKAAVTPEGAEVLEAKDGAAYVKRQKGTKAGERIEMKLTLVAGTPDLSGKDATSSAEGSAVATASSSATAAAASATPPAASDTPRSDTATTIVLVVLFVLLGGAVAALVMALRRQSAR